MESTETAGKNTSQCPVSLLENIADRKVKNLRRIEETVDENNDLHLRMLNITKDEAMAAIKRARNAGSTKEFI